MRVIGGEARGRRISAPALATLRPTSDRVREAIFDALESRGLVEGSAVLDLFAGSGALGIEALSRGASACTFVDAELRAIEAVRRNLESAGLAGRPGIRIVRAEALSFLASADVSARVAFLDPPYRFSAWAELLALLPCEYAVLEHGEPVGVEPTFHTIRRYRHGGTLVTLAARHLIDKDPA